MNNEISFNFRKWRTEELLDHDGGIVATDAQLEWMLPWWWESYRRFNSHCVAFVDYGMSEKMRNGCQKRGALIDLLLPDIFVAGHALLNLVVADSIGVINKGFWHLRTAWLKKPLSCLQSPYRRSLGRDVDCEVRGCIGELFESYGHSLCVAKDVQQSQRHSCYATYNSGVIVFKHGNPLIEEWAHKALEHNHTFLGDQDVLSWLLHEKPCFIELPGVYNWSHLLEHNLHAIVLYWHGPIGKKHIEEIMSSHF